MSEIDKKITNIILDYYTGNSNPRDIESLEEWAKASPENEKAYREYLELCNLVTLSERNAARTKAQNNLDAPLKQNLKSKRKIWLQGLSYAACVAAAIGVAVTIVLSTGKEDQPQQTQSLNKIILASDEMKIELDDNMTLRAENGIGVSSQDGDEIYNSAGEGKEYRIIVPRGAKFDLRLDDGTRVWLNSESELTFPDRFTGDRRGVAVRGEAYFEVTEDSEKPFIVSLSQGDITVYGTSFNVTDYDDSPLCAVLVKGSIGFVSRAGESVMLVPSQRMAYDRATQRISVKEVDTAKHISWMRNIFTFHDQTLRQIMGVLSRWYDVEVVFASDRAADLTLSGQLRRGEDIATLLDAYRQIAGFDYEIDNKKIFIYE